MLLAFVSVCHSAEEKSKKKMKPFADNNQDGKITAEDFPKKMQEKFKEYDLNSDGMIDPSEKETFLLESKQKKIENLQKSLNDKNGDGKITKEDLPKKLQKAFSKMDKNGDGTLDSEEKDGFLKFQEKKMQSEKSAKTKKKKKKE